MNTRKVKRIWPNAKVLKVLKELRSELEVQREYHFKAFFHNSTGTHVAQEHAFKYAISKVDELIERERQNGQPKGKTLVELAEAGKL